MPRTSRNSQAAMEAPILPPAATTTPSSPPANAVSKMNGQALTDIATNETEENVFLFVPNLIGYTRVILAALSLYFMRGNPKVCTVLYGISCLLDAFDGMAARALGQSTKFGAVLDMVTDRCTTACLLCFLTAAYPDWAIVFQGLITLDFSSHYIHMYSSLISGSQSHKTITKEQSKILWYYYNDSNTLFVVCAANEIFFVTLYLMAFYTRSLEIQPRWFFLFLGSDTATSIVKSVKANPTSYSNIIFQFIEAVTWPQLLCYITAPIWGFKQFVNGVQFWKAAKVLVGVDLVERAQKKKKSSKKNQ